MKRMLSIFAVLACAGLAAGGIILGTLQPGAGAPTLRLQGTNYVMEWGAGGGWTPISNLVAHWKMNDDAANPTVVDSVGSWNGIASEKNTEDMAVEGKVGGALYFDGGGDYISTLYPGVSGAGNRTVAYWFYYEGVWDYEVPWSYGKPASARDVFEVFFLGTRPHVHVANGDYAAIQETAKSNWYHHAVTYNGTAIIQYVNGALDKQTNVTLVTATNATALFMIGWSSYDGTWGRDWVGRIDDVRFYSRALTSNEIAAIYNGGTGTEEE